MNQNLILKNSLLNQESKHTNIKVINILNKLIFCNSIVLMYDLCNINKFIIILRQSALSHFYHSLKNQIEILCNNVLQSIQV